MMLILCHGNEDNNDTTDMTLYEECVCVNDAVQLVQIEFVFQMRVAFVTLLASASLAAELGREARSLDMVILSEIHHGFDIPFYINFVIDTTDNNPWLYYSSLCYCCH